MLFCFIYQTVPLACTPAFDDKQQVNSLPHSDVSVLQRTHLAFELLQVLSANTEHDDSSAEQLPF